MGGLGGLDGRTGAHAVEFLTTVVVVGRLPHVQRHDGPEATVAGATATSSPTARTSSRRSMPLPPQPPPLSLFHGLHALFLQWRRLFNNNQLIISRPGP